MDEFTDKIYGKQKRELEERILESVKKTEKEPVVAEQVNAHMFTKEYDETNRLLIDYYNKHTGNLDIQEELNASLVAGSMEILQERERERKLKRLDLPEGVDEQTKEQALERLEKEGNVQELDEDKLQQEIYKAIYEQVYYEYSELMMDVKDAQIENGSLTVGDEEGTKLVIYERYLSQIELENHRHGGESFSKDERIAAAREKFKREFNQKQQLVDEVTTPNIERLQTLYQTKNELASEISYYNLNSHLVTSEKMQALREKYFQVSQEIRECDPSLEEYSRQIDQIRENQEFARAEGVGANSSTDRDVAGMAMDTIGTSYQDVEKNDSLQQNMADTTDNIEAIEDLEQEEERIKIDRRKEFIRRYQEAKEKNDKEEMALLIAQYQDDLDVDSIIAEEIDEREPEVYEYNNLIGGLDAISTDDEIIDAMDKTADEALEQEKEQERDRDQGIERTIWDQK